MRENAPKISYISAIGAITNLLRSVKQNYGNQLAILYLTDKSNPLSNNLLEEKELRSKKYPKENSENVYHDKKVRS